MSSEKALVKERVWGIFSVAFRLNYGYFSYFKDYLIFSVADEVAELYERLLKAEQEKVSLL